MSSPENLQQRDTLFPEELAAVDSYFNSVRQGFEESNSNPTQRIAVCKLKIDTLAREIEEKEAEIEAGTATKSIYDRLRMAKAFWQQWEKYVRMLEGEVKESQKGTMEKGESPGTKTGTEKEHQGE